MHSTPARLVGRGLAYEREEHFVLTAAHNDLDAACRQTSRPGARCLLIGLEEGADATPDRLPHVSGRAVEERSPRTAAQHVRASAADGGGSGELS